MKLSAIVLAAGTASRMKGPNKLLLPISGKPALQIVVENLLAAGLDEVLVVTGHQEGLVREILKHFPVRFVSNPDYASGMTGSIQAGVREAEGDGFMICLADMPLLEASDYQAMASFFRKTLAEDADCICVPVCKGQQGHPVIFSASYQESILQHPFSDGCKAILKAHPQHLHRLHTSRTAFLRDMDTPEDYAQISKH